MLFRIWPTGPARAPLGPSSIRKSTPSGPGEEPVAGLVEENRRHHVLLPVRRVRLSFHRCASDGRVHGDVGIPACGGEMRGKQLLVVVADLGHVPRVVRQVHLEKTGEVAISLQGGPDLLEILSLTRERETARAVVASDLHRVADRLEVRRNLFGARDQQPSC